MKLIRFGDPGKEKPGLQLNDGTRIDASGAGSNYDEAFFESGGLAKLATWLSKNESSAPRVASSVRLGSCVARPSKIICIGLNYRDHAAETKAVRAQLVGDLLNHLDVRRFDRKRPVLVRPRP